MNLPKIENRFLLDSVFLIETKQEVFCTDKNVADVWLRRASFLVLNRRFGKNGEV